MYVHILGLTPWANGYGVFRFSRYCTELLAVSLLFSVNTMIIAVSYLTLLYVVTPQHHTSHLSMRSRVNMRFTHTLLPLGKWWIACYDKPR